MSIEIPSHLTSAERDLLTNVAAGSSFFNTDLNRIQGTFDGGATPSWNVEACVEDIKLQTAYDNDPSAVMTAIPFTFQSNTTAVPTFDLFSNVTGTVGQGIFQLNAKAKTSTDVQKDAVALRYETSNAVDATFSQDVLTQAWSFNVLTDVLKFVGTERSLYTAPILKIKGDSQVEPALRFDNIIPAADGDSVSKSINECVSSDFVDKSYTARSSIFRDSLSASFSTEVVHREWMNGVQVAWLQVEGHLNRVRMYVNFVNNIIDPEYGTSIEIEDYKFADGRMIGRSAPSALTGSCSIRTGVANEAIAVASIVTASPDVDFRMINHPVSGDDSALGVSTTSAAAAGDSYQYCHSGTVTVRMENNVAVTRGDLIGPTSNGASSPGRAAVINPPSGSQVMGVAWESVASDPAGALVRVCLGFSSSN